MNVVDLSIAAGERDVMQPRLYPISIELPMDTRLDHRAIAREVREELATVAGTIEVKHVLVRPPITQQDIIGEAVVLRVRLVGFCEPGSMRKRVDDLPGRP